MFKYIFEETEFEYLPDYSDIKDKLIKIVFSKIIEINAINLESSNNLYDICHTIVYDFDVEDALIERFEEELWQEFKQDAYADYKESKFAENPYNY